jgi:hypothetical protein
MIAAEDRWLSKVSIPPEVLTGCWLWTGARDTHGYGHLSVNGRLRLAHRFAWKILHGEMPGWQHVLHSCHGGHLGCVNPAHLRLGTHRENMLEMARAGRQGNAKVSAADVQAIRADRRALRDIASQYGLSRSAVCLIRQRKNWRHVP